MIKKITVDMKCLIIFFMIIGAASLIPYSYSDSDSEQILMKVKDVAGWWADRLIPQKQFTNSLEHLINQGIIHISTTESNSEKPEKIIPEWVRKTTQWWSNDKITDSEFVNAMKYLINVGVIHTNAVSADTEEEKVKIKHLHVLLKGYPKVHADENFVLDVKVFDAEKYGGREFDKFDHVINDVHINIEIFNEEDKKIHDFQKLTKYGMVHYEVSANETTQKKGVWLKDNKYTVKISASLNEQITKKEFEFIGDISKRHYPQSNNHGNE